MSLGGFHTCVSFLGSIAHLMTGSGLQSILELIYADHTVPHMLSGKAIARVIREHLIVSGVLHGMIVARAYQLNIQINDAINNILDNTNEQHQPIDLFNLREDIDDDLLSIADLLEETMSKNVKAEDVEHEHIVQEMLQKIEMVKDELASSKTAQLWFQYLDMIDIVCNFIKAERTGNWALHLKSLSDMLPYFAASGNHLYAKSGYGQSLTKVSIPHSKFVEGYHIVRRSHRFWAGLSSELIIEQVLMHSIKTTGVRHVHIE